MKIGFIGLGKLGLPCAVSISMKGHEVIGYDLDKSRMSKEPQPYKEAGPHGDGDFNDYLAKSEIKFGDMQEIVDNSEIIFIAVQTPHNPRYEGIDRIPDERVDFDYTYLKNAVEQLAKQQFEEDKVIVVISTCLPGTMERHIKPLLNDHMKLVYNPFFIAMGATMRDFLETEFVLLGADDILAMREVAGFYETIYDSSVPFEAMSIESAELTKVAYNTFISLKIAFANLVMEICQKLGNADCDDVMDALKKSTKRLISPAYLTGGMGDGGGCHPRDNIAMSCLARKLNLSYDLFESAMMCREKQAEWLAEIAISKSMEEELPIIILGYAFKPESNLTVGSPAVLVANLIKVKGYSVEMIDGSIDGARTYLNKQAVYLIGCKHERYATIKFPMGSYVIDPFRYVEDNVGVRVLRIGRGK